MSLSSRRAWIEIYIIKLMPFCTSRRSPHGERGLKLSTKGGGEEKNNVALLTESVD